MTATERFVTQSEASAICGCAEKTIRRHRARGSFPGARRRDDLNGTYEIPVTDLVAAGLWTPDQPGAAVEEVGARRGTSGSFDDLRLELERAKARIEALTVALEDRRDEVAYLRRALEAALRGRAA